MKLKIKAIYLKDGKQLFYPSDDEWNKLYNQIEKVEIEESYSKEEWEAKFIVVRTENAAEKAKETMYQEWKAKTGLW